MQQGDSSARQAAPGERVTRLSLGRLSVSDIQRYIQISIELARDPQALADLKSHLRNIRHSAPLCDTARYCRNLESAYEAIWERHVRGDRPATLWV